MLTIKSLSVAAAAALVLAGGAQAAVTTSTVGNTTTYTENFENGTSFTWSGNSPWHSAGSDDYLWLNEAIFAAPPVTASSASYSFTSASAISSLTLSFWYSAPDVPIATNDKGVFSLTGPSLSGTTTLPSMFTPGFTGNNPGAGGNANDAQYTNTWTNLAAGSYTLTFAKGANSVAGLKVDDVSIQVTAVPEPTGIALALAGFGVMGLAATRRRRRRRI